QVFTDGQKRWNAKQRLRTTERLNLDNLDEAGETQLSRLLHILRTKKKIVVIAGAGISISAGIPEFRSSEGLFKTFKTKYNIKGSGSALFNASVYNDNKSTATFHNMLCNLSILTKDAKPTPFHNMLATIANEGRLLRLYTQNINCLETSLSSLATKLPLPIEAPWPVAIHVHGGLEKMYCTKWMHISHFKADLFQGPEPSLCKLCAKQDDVRTRVQGKRSHGIGRLRPRIVLYDEPGPSPDEEAVGNVSEADLKEVPDAVLVVGTSLRILSMKRIARCFCLATRSTPDGFTAWINPDPEPQNRDLKDLWDLVVCGKSDVVANLFGLPSQSMED
ncbi:DHS-like NAD/FAD-binding domain-containing protein, partial [Cryphonectria parasitica EP155]